MPKFITKTSPKRKQVYYPKKSYQTAIRVLKSLAENGPSVLSIKQIAEKLGSERNPKPHVRIKLILEELARLDYCTEYGKISNSETRCQICGKSGKYLVEKPKLNSAVSIQESNAREYPKHKDAPYFQRELWFICEPGYVLGKSIISMKCFECNNITGIHGVETKYKIHDNERYWSLSDNGIVVMLTLLSKKELLSFYSKNPKHKIVECINILYEKSEIQWVDALIMLLKSRINVEPNALKYANEWLVEQYQRHEFFSAYRSYGHVSHGLGAPIG